MSVCSGALASVKWLKISSVAVGAHQMLSHWRVADGLLRSSEKFHE